MLAGQERIGPCRGAYFTSPAAGSRWHTVITDKRIASLDILRGFALLGMFVVHFHDHSTDPGGIDDVIRTFIWRFVESKSHGTFALLFGAGFAIQLRRAEARGAPFASLYLRRLAVLAAFGFAAHAFFGFNVLLGYAVWGVPLLLIRRWSTRTLLIVARAVSAVRSRSSTSAISGTYVDRRAGRRRRRCTARAGRRRSASTTR